MAQVFDRWDPVNEAYDSSTSSTGAKVGTGVGVLGGAILGGTKLGSIGGTAIAPGIGTAIGAIGGAAVGAGVGLLGGGIGGNTKFSLSNNNGKISFSPGSGSFYRYNNEEGEERDLVNHIYWNKNSGDVYYLDPDSKTYTKLDTTGLDTSGGALQYASDDQLDAMAKAIASTIRNNRNLKAQQKLLQLQLVSAGSSALLTVTVPSPVSPDSIQLQEYLKKKQEADTLLEKMLVEDPDVSGADKTKEDKTVYYKYGPDEIDLNYYLHNLGTNLQKYIESKGWNDSQKEAFLKSYEDYKTGLTELLDTKSGRFYTDDSGAIKDTNNILIGGNDKVIIDLDGVTYGSYDEIPNKNLRRTAKEFSASQEVGKYLSTVGQAIVGAGKTKKTTTQDSTGAFDLNKNGFINYWVSKINPGGGDPDIEPYLALDPVGPDGKRERTNRTKYLAFLLNSYLNRINKSKFDFSNSTFKTKNAYIAKIKLAIDNLNNGWDTTDPASLQAIGITPNFYTALMTDTANPLMTEQEISAEMLKNKNKAASDYISRLKGVYDNFASQGHTFTENNAVSFVKDSRYNPTSSGAAQRIGTALENLGYPVDEASVANSSESLWESVKAALRAGETTVTTRSGKKPLSDILSIIFPMYESQFKDSETNPGVKYLNDVDHDLQYGAILCLKNGKLYYDFIGNEKKCLAWQQLKANFEKNYVVSEDKPLYSFDKLGGVLRKLQEGGNIGLGAIDAETMAALQKLMAASLAEEASQTSETSETPAASTTDTSTTSQMTPGEALAQALYGPRHAAAEAKGMSYEQYNKKQRSPNGKPDFYNKDSGHWNTEDYLRLGSIVADIASLVMDPVTGAATNVGSTATKFLADWADDSVTAGEMWKNLGMNLGMDALSIVPIVGDAAGTGSKLVKSVKAIAPKLMYGLTAWGILGTLKNGNNIMESFQKVMSDEKLTVGDWQNIALAITAVAGVNGAVKSGVAKKLAKNNARVEDAVGLGLKKKNSDGTYSKPSDYIFRGEKAKSIKKLILDGDIEGLNKKIQEIEGFSDYEINTNLKSKPVSVGLPFGKKDGKWGTKNPFSVERAIDSFEVFDPRKLKGGYASRNLLSTGRLDAVEATNIFDEASLKTKAEVDAIQEAQIKEDAADAIAATEKRKGRITATQEKIEGVKDENGNVVKEGLVRKKQASETAKATAEAELVRAREALDNISAEHKKTYRTIGGVSYYAEKLPRARLKGKVNLDDAVESLANDISTQKTSLSNLTAEHAAKKARLDELEAKRKLNKTERAEKAALITEINNLERSKNTLTTKITADEARLRQLTEWQSEYKRAKELGELLDPNFAGSNAAKKLELDAQIAQYDIDLANLRKRLERLKGTAENGTGSKDSWEKQQLLAKIASGPYTVEYAPGKTREVKNIQQIIEDLHLYKKGGRLLFLLPGGNVNQKGNGNVVYSQPVNWYSDYIMNGDEFSLEAKDAYGRITLNNLDSYNNLQNVSYRSVFEVGKQTPASGKGSDIGYSDTAYNHQLEFLRLAPSLNTRFTSMGKFEQLPGAYTGDDAAHNWTDGRAGSMTYLRHLGDNQSYVDKINNANILGEGVEAFWNDKTQMVNFRAKGANPDNSSTIDTGTGTGDSTEPSMIQPPKQDVGGTGDTNNGNDKNNGPSLSGLEKLKDYLPNPLEYLRYKLLSSANARNTQKAIEAEKPFFLTPQTDYTVVHSDLAAEAAATKKKADLLRQGTHAITSDGALLMNFLKELEINGLAYQDQGMALSTATYRTTQKEDFDQRKVNHTNEHNTAMQNALAAHQTEANKEKIRQAGEAQLANDRDVYLQGLSSQIQTAQQKQEALNDAATKSRMELAVKNNPEKYGVQFTSEEKAAYEKALAGITSGSLTSAEITALASANNKVALAQTNWYYKLKGIPDDLFTEDASKVASTTSTGTSYTTLLTDPADEGTASKKKGGTIELKDGSKLEVAKIRAKAKNADRLLKSIEKQIASLDKKLDRISKSMYGLPKLSIVKSK